MIEDTALFLDLVRFRVCTASVDPHRETERLLASRIISNIKLLKARVGDPNNVQFVAKKKWQRKKNLLAVVSEPKKCPLTGTKKSWFLY